MKPAKFWATAAAVASAVAILLAFAFPYGLLGADGDADRRRVWLLCLWTFGVLAICFGGAGLLNAFSGVGFRDVSEAGSLEIAVEAKRDSLRHAGSGFYNFAGWTVSTGLFLVLIYFVAWISTGS